jgi:type I restriction enzyme S subunit
MSWRAGTIGDLVSLQRGHDLTGDQQKPGDIPVIGSAGPNGFHDQAKSVGPGVTVGRSGASIGRVTYVDRGYWPHNTCLYVTDFKGNVPRFVAYLLERAELAQLNSGAAQPSLNRNFVYGVKIKFPDVSEQERIVSLLAAYEDLAANNKRRIELLDQSARLLFEEWFVRLRYPGHEHDAIVDGVPKGWTRKTIADLCVSIDYGYTASADKEIVGPKYLRITDIVPKLIDWANVPYCAIDEAKEEKFRVKEGDIVIARTGATVGYAKRLHKRHPNCVFASYLVRLRLKPNVDDLLVGVFVESDSYKSFIRSRIGGAAQPNANAKVLTSARILVPTPGLQRLYREFVEPLFDQRELLEHENAKLAKACDLLLPRVMDGRIEV